MQASCCIARKTCVNGTHVGTAGVAINVQQQEVETPAGAVADESPPLDKASVLGSSRRPPSVGASANVSSTGASAEELSPTGG